MADIQSEVRHDFCKMRPESYIHLVYPGLCTHFYISLGIPKENDTADDSNPTLR